MNSAIIKAKSSSSEAIVVYPFSMLYMDMSRTLHNSMRIRSFGRYRQCFEIKLFQWSYSSLDAEGVKITVGPSFVENIDVTKMLSSKPSAGE